MPIGPRTNPYAYTINTCCTPTQPPPYDGEYYQGPPTAPIRPRRATPNHPPREEVIQCCPPPPISYPEAYINIQEEVKMKVSAKDVTVCASCSSANLTETCDPMVAKECLDCGSLMLIDGDVLQMAV